MGRVGELAELAGDEIGGLLADVDGVVADPLEAARDEDHPQAPLPRLLVAADLEQAVDDAAIGAVDQLVEVEQRLGQLLVTGLERLDRDTDHLLGPLAHLAEAGEERVVGRQSLRQLRQLRDRDAEVAHPLEVEVVLQHREHEPEVARDGRLAGEQQLDPLLDLEVLRVDVVVERDHLVGELGVLRADGLDRRPDRAQDEIALVAERGLELVELLLERDAHQPNRPVT